ncbi:hypothetical protein [Bosea vaviloviae]|uniref:TnsA endonuclease N-terminal domain-containing protein n=1 Tax=Bosea vaviloviae TaxID=1526658 RepID=A0A0N1F4S7_9HYPH|nr:hypothetical protein [Bosea vaviloviae]KPH81421.1 hypothetical protein AE618_08825 [Bosea vaviloviae]
MKRPSIHPSKLGIHAGAQPCGPDWSRGSRQCWQGTFASGKALGPSPFRSFLERDCQTLLEANPAITAYSVEPHVLKYSAPNAAGDFEARTYVPDFGLITADGQILIVDAKAEALRQMAGWTRREPHIREAYAIQHGVRFLVLTEAAIRKRPRLANCEEMLAHREPGTDLAALTTIRDVLATVEQSSTIGALTAAASLVSPPGQDRAFTAIMRLALRGEIKLDLSRPFSPTTSVRR